MSKYKLLFSALSANAVITIKVPQHGRVETQHSCPPNLCHLYEQRFASATDLDLGSMANPRCHHLYSCCFYRRGADYLPLRWEADKLLENSALCSPRYIGASNHYLIRLFTLNSLEHLMVEGGRIGDND